MEGILSVSSLDTSLESDPSLHCQANPTPSLAGYRAFDWLEARLHGIENA